GGDAPAARNVIAANADNGIAIVQASSNVIHGNYIGTDASGTAAIRNGFFGVSFLSGTNNTVGGLTPGAGNVISGNRIGIDLKNSSAQFNLIQGNFIGTDATGTVALGNDLSGIVLEPGTAFNTIGGDTREARNIISANGIHGISITQSSGNVIQGNYIGTDVTGTIDLGNRRDGVRITANANNNLIGGSLPGMGNVI